MIITEHFVFIHMHKTGGQTLNDIIQHTKSSDDIDRRRIWCAGG